MLPPHELDVPLADLTLWNRAEKNLKRERSSTSGVRSPTHTEWSFSPGISRVLWWFSLKRTGCKKR